MLRRRIFDEEHNMFRDSVRKWTEEHVVPHQEQWREDRLMPRNVWKKAGEAGYLCMWADEKHGGMGLNDFRFDQILIEEVQGREPSFMLPLQSRVIGPYMENVGNDEQRDRYMPGIVSGDIILSIGMTEPGAGSDLAGMKTRAVDKGDHWELTGQKTYISSGIHTDLCIVAAKTDPDNPYAVGLFLVEGDQEGFRKSRKLNKLGLHAQDTAELFFDSVKVPKHNVLGDPKGGFKAMMKNLAEERLGASCQSLAMANRAFDVTMEFIQDRKAFGKSIGTYQNTRFKMADMRTKIDVAQAMIDHCVMDHIDGQLSSEHAAEIKLFASEVQGYVVDECLQLHGGAGYMDEYEICRLYADARISRIFAGTSEIMLEIIGRGLGLDDRKR